MKDKNGLLIQEGDTILFNEKSYLVKRGNCFATAGDPYECGELEDALYIEILSNYIRPHIDCIALGSLEDETISKNLKLVKE